MRLLFIIALACLAITATSSALSHLSHETRLQRIERTLQQLEAANAYLPPPFEAEPVVIGRCSTDSECEAIAF